EGGGEIELTLKGRDFFPVSSVCFGGCRVPTTFVSQRELRATIPSYLVRAGTLPVCVINPKPHEFPDMGGTSNSAAFIVKFARLARAS
ncbi:MAG: IPT/TIG domain-containing protein, partial [Candidatus Binatia bacterium]